MKRMIALLMALMLLIGAFGCAEDPKRPKKIKTYNENAATEEAEQEPKEEPKKEPLESEELNPAPYEAAYQDLINDFKLLVDFRFSGQFDENWQESLDALPLSNTLLSALAENNGVAFDYMLFELYGEDFGYILFDLNQDKTPELFWISGDHTIEAIFTYIDGRAKILEAFWPRYWCSVTNNGNLRVCGSGGAGCHSYELLSLNAAGELVSSCSFINDWGEYYEYTENGQQEISEDRFSELEKLYLSEPATLWPALTIQPLE